MAHTFKTDDTLFAVAFSRHEGSFIKKCRYVEPIRERSNYHRVFVGTDPYTTQVHTDKMFETLDEARTELFRLFTENIIKNTKHWEVD